MAGKPLDETDRRIIQHLREDGRRSMPPSPATSASRRRRCVSASRACSATRSSPSPRPRTRRVSGSLPRRWDQGGGRSPRGDRACDRRTPRGRVRGHLPGEYDVHADVVCETRERLYEVVVELIRALPGVRDADVVLYAECSRPARMEAAVGGLQAASGRVADLRPAVDGALHSPFGYAEIRGISVLTC